MWGFNFSCHDLRFVFYREGTNLKSEIPMQDYHEWFRYVFAFMVAAMAQFLMRLNSLDKTKPFPWGNFFAAGLLSGFIGFLICMAAHSYGLPDEAGGALAGLGGMMGKDGVNILKGFLERGGR